MLGNNNEETDTVRTTDRRTFIAGSAAVAGAVWAAPAVLGMSSGAASAASGVCGQPITPPFGAFVPSPTTVLTVSGNPVPVLGAFDPGSTTLTLTGLPTHAQLKVDFRAYFLNSWDGDAYPGPETTEENFRVSVDTITAFFHSFANPAVNTTFGVDFKQTYFTGAPPIRSNSPATQNAGSGAALTNAVSAGGGFGGTGGGSTIYDLSFTIPHTANTAVILFEAPGQQSGNNDEPYALSNIVVTPVC